MADERPGIFAREIAKRKLLDCPIGEIDSSELWECFDIATRPAPKADSALVGELLSHVEQVCGPLSTEATVLPGDDDRSVLAANFASILAALSDRDVVLEEAVRKAEDNAWQEARELVRGTNADMCRTAVRAYQIIQEGMTNAVNNRKLRTLKGRVAAFRALKGGVDE